MHSDTGKLRTRNWGLLLRETLSELRVCGLRCPDILTAKTKVFSIFCYPWDPLKVLGSKETLLSSVGLPCLELFRRKGKGATLDMLAQTLHSKSQLGVGHLVFGAVQPAITMIARVS